MSTENVTETVDYSPDPTLTPLQHRIVNKLAAGLSAAQAAESENIHRNTIANWRRTVPAFHREIELAGQQQCRVWRDAATALAPLAIQNLREILMSDKASLSLKFRASLAILKMATAAAPTLAPAAELASFVPPPGNAENLHNPAQSCTTAPELAPFVPPAADPKTLHKPAQSAPTRRLSEAPRTVRRPPLPGRNSLCPCESGRKFKRCCAQNFKFSYYRSSSEEHALSSGGGGIKFKCTIQFPGAVYPSRHAACSAGNPGGAFTLTSTLR